MVGLEQEAAVGGRSPGITMRDSLSVYFSSTDPIRWLSKSKSVRLRQLFCGIYVLELLYYLSTQENTYDLHAFLSLFFN